MGVIRVPKDLHRLGPDTLQGELRQASGLIVPRCVVEGVVIGRADPSLDHLVAIDGKIVPQIAGKNA